MEMKLQVIKVNPTENMTILVMDPLPRKEYLSVASLLMEYGHLHGEQVGFLERPLSEGMACARLQMMGGEFCINGLRSMAAAMVHKGRWTEQKESGVWLVILEVSGLDDGVACRVVKGKSSWEYEVEAPIGMPKKVKKFQMAWGTQVYEGCVVEFAGITHVVVWGAAELATEGFFQGVRQQLHEERYEALGVMIFQKETGTMVPMVYVSAMDSLVWERGCGSGTAAVGAVLALERKEPISREIHQPGGILQVDVDWEENKISAIRIGGTVGIVSEGTAYL